MGGIRTSSVRTIYSKFRCFGCLIRRRKFRRFWPKRAKRLLICTLRSVKHFKDAQIIAIGRIVCPQTQRNGPMREHGIAILCFLCLHPVGLLQPTEVMYSVEIRWPEKKALGRGCSPIAKVKLSVNLLALLMPTKQQRN